VDLHRRDACATGAAGAAAKKVRVGFHHGLGDRVYFAHMLPLYARRGYAVEVVCTPVCYLP
jgi:hypothetical protein